MASLVRFEGVTKRFRKQIGLRGVEFDALSHVDFHIAEGEFVGLIGHNGAGKSTAIKLLMGFLTPNAGAVSVRGKRPDEAGARRSLGYVPENSSFSDFLTGGEILDAFGAISGLDRATRRARATQLLESLDIAHARDRLVRTYSKGMTQRLALAQALIGRPEVLILDEPMTGLDPIGRRQVLDVLTAELKRGVSLLFCSHLLADVEHLCDRVLWLQHGKVHYDGAVGDLLVDRSHFELTYRGSFLLEGAEEVSREVYRLHVAPDALVGVIGEIQSRSGSVESFEPASKALEQVFVETNTGTRKP